MVEIAQNVYVFGAFIVGVAMFATYEEHAYSGDFDRFLAAVFFGALWPALLLFLVFVAVIWALGDEL